jgi:hypothetical protein
MADKYQTTNKPKGTVVKTTDVATGDHRSVHSYLAEERVRYFG